MSIADTQKARLYANRAEVAAAQCQIYTDEARRAPEYTDLAKQYAEIAEASEEAATIAAQSAQQSSNSASSDASNAIQASSEAQNARDSAVSSAESASSSATSASDSEEIAQQSALSASESAATAAAAVSKTIRVNDTDISPIPDVASRANKVLSFDASGNPIATTPSSGSAADVLNELAAPGGVSLVNGAVSESNLLAPSAPSMIGVMPQGNLSQLLIYVTPEQFGAIGDGTVHPLSERYSTLAAAQAVYPFVTALTQTIDWAACQAADNYSRGISVVKAPRTAIYHFGSNYLELGINSKWDSGYPVSNDVGQCPRMTRNIETTIPSFGQYCIVRVKNASSAGSADEFVRGVVFKGFCLTYGLPSRSPSKGSQRICLHLNYGIGACIEVAVKGGEYGVFGYSCWGSTGVLVIDSCHKGFYADPVTATPENTTPPPNSNTSFDFRVRLDACPFGIVLRNCQYSKFTGFIEGAVIGWDNYDSVNETAVAITSIGCVNCSFFVGIEAWQGVHMYARNGNVRMYEHWNQGYNIVNTTGKQGAYYSMSLLMSVADPYPIPPGNNCMYYSISAASFSLNDINCDFSDATTYADVYFCNLDSTSTIIFDNCTTYFGSNGGRLAPANWGGIDVIGGKYIIDILTPSGYTYIGKGKCVARDYTSTGLASDGTVTITPPAGWKIIAAEAYLLTSSSSQAAAGATTIKSKGANGSSITFQSGQASTAYSLYSRLTLQVTK